MKKVFISISSVLILAIAGVIIYFSIPKVDMPELVVTLNDISVNIGEKVKVDYKTSLSSAVITMKVENTKIAKLENEFGGNFVMGCSEGETILMLKARYKDESFEKAVVVNVSKNIKDDVVDNEDNSSSLEEPDDKPIETPNDEKVEDEIGVNLEFSNLINCSVNENTISVYKDKKAIFSISSEINLNKDNFKIISDPSLNLSLVTGVGNNTYSIKATNCGSYKVTFIVDEKEIDYLLTVN